MSTSDSADGGYWSAHAAFLLVLVLRLRKGEVFGLSWPAVDVAERELTIDQQLQRLRRELLLRQTTTAASDGTLLVDLEVHPRVIMRILRHADVSMTTEIYANASSTATSEALRRLGESLR